MFEENLDNQTRDDKAAEAASMLEWALDWAACGVAVFPCNPLNKQPLIPKGEGGHGFHDATIDAQQIALGGSAGRTP